MITQISFNDICDFVSGATHVDPIESLLNQGGKNKGRYEVSPDGIWDYHQGKTIRQNKEFISFCNKVLDARKKYRDNGIPAEEFGSLCFVLSLETLEITL